MSRIYTTQSTLNQFAFILVAIRQLSAADLITDLFYEQLPKYESLPHEIQCNAKCEQKYVAGETLMSLQQHFNQRIMNNNNNRKLLELELIYNIHQNESILDLSFCQTFIHFIGKQLFISSKKSNQLLPSYMNKSSDIIGLNMTDYLCNLHINKCVICNENDGCFIQCSHNNCHTPNPGGNGKSTLFKQLRKIHGEGFLDKDRMGFKDHIYSQVIEQMKNENGFDHSKLSPNGEKSAQYIDCIRNDMDVDESVATNIEILWKESAIRETFDNRSKLKIDDSSSYFLMKFESKIRT